MGNAILWHIQATDSIQLHLSRHTFALSDTIRPFFRRRSPDLTDDVWQRTYDYGHTAQCPHSPHMHRTLDGVHYDKLAYASNSLLTGKHSHLINRSGVLLMVRRECDFVATLRSSTTYAALLHRREKSRFAIGLDVAVIVFHGHNIFAGANPQALHTHRMHLLWLIASGTTEPNRTSAGFIVLQ